MAKRKSKKSAGVGISAAPSSPSSSKKNVDMGVEEVDNGFIARVSSNGEGGEYRSKKFIAPDYASAIRIATEGMAGMSSKSKGGGKKKNGKRKVISTKKV